MNKILPITLVVVLSGCSVIPGHMELLEYELKWDRKIEAAKEKCLNANTTMTEYVHCSHEAEEKIGRASLDDTYLFTEGQYIHRYSKSEKARKLAKTYHLVIAEEVDAGRASKSKAILEMQTISELLNDREDAKMKNTQDTEFVKGLMLLDIYSKAIERTTLQR